MVQYSGKYGIYDHINFIQDFVLFWLFSNLLKYSIPLD